MNKTVEEINKMIMEDAPMEEINDAIGYIDIYSCADIGKRHSLLSVRPLSARSGTHGM